jgi:hypothetical protein
MNRVERDALIVRAKAIATPVVSCVAARLRPDHLLARRTKAELAALVIVLAEAADPVTLRAVVAEQDDDRTPGATDRTVMLRKAHAEVQRMRIAGEALPLRLKLLDGEYRREREKVTGRKGRGSRAA